MSFWVEDIDDENTIRSADATYEIETQLGRGSFGDVHKATEIKDDGTTQTVAIKVMELDSMQMGGKDLFSIERDAMKAVSQLDHPNIVKILDSWCCERTGNAYIVMDYVDGENLGVMIEIYGPLDEDRARKIFTQLIDAVEHCHMRGVRHRDLKPDNIVVQSDDRIKLLDFGFASIFEGAEKASPKQHSPVGTQLFMAPEVCMEKRVRIGYSGAAADVYACGMTLLVMLTGWPDETKAMKELARLMFLGMDVASTLGISKDAYDLIRSMISHSTKRATLHEIKNHPWLQRKSSN